MPTNPITFNTVRFVDSNSDLANTPIAESADSAMDVFARSDYESTNLTVLRVTRLADMLAGCPRLYFSDVLWKTILSALNFQLCDLVRR